MNCLKFGTKHSKKLGIMAFCAIFLVISQMKAIVVKDVGLVLDFFVSHKHGA